MKPSGSLIAFTVAIAALAAFSFPAPAQAQDETYVDLSIEITAGVNFTFTARNKGTADAYGVTVDVEIADQIIHGSSAGFEQKSGVTCSGNIPGTACISGVWTVGTLRVGEETSFGIQPRLASGLPCCTQGSNRWTVPARAVIKSTVPEEEERFKGDNTAVGWISVDQIGTGTVKAEGDYWLEAGVDDLLPEAGDTVKFSFKASMKLVTSVRNTTLHGVKLRLGLPYGMGTPTATTTATGTTFTAATGLTRTWDWDIGTFESNTPLNLVVSTTLDNPLPTGVARSDLCLTAELTAERPNNISSLPTSAEICLREDPVTLLQTGETHLFTPYPCVGVSTYPCSSSDTVEMVVNGGESARAAGIARDDAIMDPGNVIVRVKDPEGRVVTGSDLSWVSTDSGLPTSIDNSRLSSSDWTHFLWKIASVQLPTGGNLAIGPDASRVGLFVHTGTKAQHPPSGLTAMPSALKVPFSTYIRFESLGTYIVDFTQETRHNNGTATTTDDVDYSATGRYTFHVGPVAELEVRDGGASPHLAADRNALTIVAANNGPDHSPGARVTGLPTDAEVLHVSQGAYDESTGVWNIGALEYKDLFRARGRPDPTLVLAATAGDTARVAIENSAAYTVCIGSDAGTLAHTTETDCEAVTGASWHEGTVYDYKDDNNTATITASRGTGGVGPDVPGNARTLTGITAVTWEPVEYLYGLPVERYEVQWLGNDWTSVDRSVTDEQHVDTAPSGRRDYRVRAVNTAGVAGPWSRSTSEVQAGKAGPPLNLRAEADGNNAIDVSWDAPEDEGGSAVTAYTVQWSSDGSEGSWRNAGSTPDQTFKHRGLKTGEVRWYRVAAQNRSGLGLWSDPVEGQTVSGTPDAPTLKAKTLSDYQIELTWNEPKDNGQPITGYEIGWSADGSADSWDRLVEVGADPVTYTDDTLPANTRRHYRVRAVNSVGGGAWSRSVWAITQLTPPDAPSLTSVEADGPNAIVVTWQEPWYLGNLSITQYEVQWAKDQYSEIWRGPAKLSGSTLSWRHTGLKPDETWYYQVRASNGGGRWSPWSYIWAATTASDNAPKAVSGLNAQFDKDSYQVNLTWNDLAGDGQTISYELEWSEDGSDWRDLTTVSSCDAGKCAYADTNIWPGAKLYYRVRASIDGDAGPWSSAKSVSVPPDPPDEPQIMWVEADGSNHIYLEWLPPYYDGGAAITGYGLLWCRALDGADDDPCREAVPDENNPLADPPGYSRISLGASQRSYSHSVSPGYNYYYLLRATNGGNRWSEWEAYDIFYGRTYAGVPAAPGLTAQAVDANQIRLTWTRPNSYGSEITEYWLYIYQDGENLHDWDNILDILRVPGDRTEWTIGGLDPETTRYFRIRALSDNGEGKYSKLRHATTPAN